MNTNKITCVICPVGCEIEVDSETVNGEVKILDVRNNKCPRGYKYASAEVVCPERVLTSTVTLSGGEASRVPVKSAKPVPKTKLFDCMREIKAVSISSPVKMGDIIIHNIADTGVDIIATRNG